MSHDDFKEMIPVHALSALDAADDHLLIEHLNQCAECRLELSQWQATAATLALSTDAVEPPSRLREKILSQARTDKQSSPGAKVLSFTPPQKSIWRSFGSLSTIAATLLLAALLVFVVILWRENRSNKLEIARLNAEIQERQLELDQKKKFVEMFEKPGTKFSELKGMPIAPDANAKLAYDTSGHAMMMTQGLPAAPAGREYQLWFIVPGKNPMPGGTFATDNQGKSVMEDQVPPEAMNSVVFAITLERKGGVSSPEGPLYLRSVS